AACACSRRVLCAGKFKGRLYQPVEWRAGPEQPRFELGVRLQGNEIWVTGKFNRFDESFADAVPAGRDPGDDEPGVFQLPDVRGVDLEAVAVAFVHQPGAACSVNLCQAGTVADAHRPAAQAHGAARAFLVSLVGHEVDYAVGGVIAEL